MDVFMHALVLTGRAPPDFPKPIVACGSPHIVVSTQVDRRYPLTGIRPSPEYVTTGDSSISMPSRIVAPAASRKRRRCASRSRRLVSASSAPVPSVFFYGENSSVRATSSTEKRVMYGKTSKMSISSFIPFGLVSLTGVPSGRVTCRIFLREYLERGDAPQNRGGVKAVRDVARGEE
ncbi:hypothetical protein BGW80DRAFT_1449323 [Lactifluus volemus]|nr:hypothetical protein BGW80DRAFT_1449323 [Lactifluus volemus]